MMNIFWGSTEDYQKKAFASDSYIYSEFQQHNADQTVFNFGTSELPVKELCNLRESDLSGYKVWIPFDRSTIEIIKDYWIASYDCVTQILMNVIQKPGSISNLVFPLKHPNQEEAFHDKYFSISVKLENGTVLYGFTTSVNLLSLYIRGKNKWYTFTLHRHSPINSESLYELKRDFSLLDDGVSVEITLLLNGNVRICSLSDGSIRVNATTFYPVSNAIPPYKIVFSDLHEYTQWVLIDCVNELRKVLTEPALPKETWKELSIEYRHIMLGAPCSEYLIGFTAKSTYRYENIFYSTLIRINNDRWIPALCHRKGLDIVVFNFNEKFVLHTMKNRSKYDDSLRDETILNLARLMDRIEVSEIESFDVIVSPSGKIQSLKLFDLIGPPSNQKMNSEEDSLSNDYKIESMIYLENALDVAKERKIPVSPHLVFVKPSSLDKTQAWGLMRLDSNLLILRLIGFSYDSIYQAREKLKTTLHHRPEYSALIFSLPSSLLKSDAQILDSINYHAIIETNMNEKYNGYISITFNEINVYDTQKSMPLESALEIRNRDKPPSQKAVPIKIIIPALHSIYKFNPDRPCSFDGMEWVGVDD